MDHALAGQSAESCPFHSYRDSLVAFARAIYGLRILDGRCHEPGQPEGCGFYDPHELYPRPPADRIIYTGTRIIHTEAEQLNPAGVPNSYGIDLIEIDLHPAVDGQSLTVRIETDPAAAAELHVELGTFQDSGPDNGPAVVESFEPMPPGRRDGHRSVTFQQLNTAHWNRLALIITRLDSADSVDSRGGYTVVLEPDSD